MTRRCILHAGMHKTGSTSIQNSLYRNPTLEGATYVDVGVPNASGALMQAFGQWRMHSSPLRPAITPEFRAFRRQVSRQQLGQEVAKGGPCVILSGEDACRLEPAEVQDMRQLLRQHIKETHVIAYVRDAKGYMESIYQQLLKGGGKGLLLWEVLYPRYRFTLKKFDLAFGREHVTLVPFQTSALAEGCVVRDFCQRTGVRIDPSTVLRANEGMSRNATALLVNYRRLIGMDTRYGAALDPALHGVLRVESYMVHDFLQVPGPKLRFAPELLADFLAQKGEDLDWISQRIGHDVRHLGSASADDIHCDADILRLSPEALDWLAQRSGVALPPPPPSPPTCCLPSKSCANGPSSGCWPRAWVCLRSNYRLGCLRVRRLPCANLALRPHPAQAADRIRSTCSHNSVACCCQ
ncbi:hypothetical protein [Vitreoscilla filiformis]|uniref:hypothetical protein n=1 Tax=Vitreoscilla filiformis TaxID=63 RepID=UPI0012FD9722|nr:hypothetical protein [Vitreoscilla filiformis]